MKERSLNKLQAPFNQYLIFKKNNKIFSSQTESELFFLHLPKRKQGSLT